MNSKAYQMSDDWGWFVDIECNDFGNNILLQPCKSSKKIKYNFNKLHIIEEDEYEYYHRNYKDPEENYTLNSKNGVNNNTFVNVGSTTLITALLTYIIFCIL